MNKKQKLELTWIGKDNPEYDISNIEPRILEENKELSYGDSNSENMIIHGDNLLALKALLPEYEGKIKCIYIDPPYNIDATGVPYDDCVEHSLWLSLMKPRLELLRLFLRDDGVIFVQIDDTEHAYLKVLMDEIFGRLNFVNSISVKMSEASGVKMNHANKRFPKIKEHILFYKKGAFSGFNEIEKYMNPVWDKENNIFLENFTTEERNNLIKLEEKEKLTEIDMNNAIKLLSNAKRIPLSKKIQELKLLSCDDIDKWKFENAYRIIKTAGSSSLAKLVKSYKDIPSQDISAGLSKEKILFYYITDFNRNTTQPRLQVIFADSGIYKNPCDFWQDIKTTGAIANEGGVVFSNSKKPEKLVHRIIKMTTNVGDSVLDSFLGSGTTCAVAHKMERKYIGIEMGDHAYTHVCKRIKGIIDGTDLTGISKIVNWKSGGGFKFYELAPSFIIKDEFGNPVIDNYYNDTKLIKAMCKLKSYTYKPSQTEYWKHGVGQGNNYLYITTQLLTSAMVQKIADHLGINETLLICPTKYEPGAEKLNEKILVKKIPQSILKACQFGKKEYLLPIKEQIIEEETEEENL